jgi:hypothetical protein
MKRPEKRMIEEIKFIPTEQLPNFTIEMQLETIDRRFESYYTRQLL